MASNNWSASVSPITNKIVSNNFCGNNFNPTWKYCLRIPNIRRWKLNYCGEEFRGGVYRLKHHLVRTMKDVKLYTIVPYEVKNQITIVVDLKTKMIHK